MIRQTKTQKTQYLSPMYNNRQQEHHEYTKNSKSHNATDGSSVARDVANCAHDLVGVW